MGMAAAMATQLVLAIVLGFLLGHWMDGLLHTSPWLTIVGVLAGIVAGFVGLFHLSKVMPK
ncbi:AtpZ/AtpI family protein [Sulfobacillus sp. DSM 109850]|uniref:AtpZ/AtpI family protein n=1 Tax=Sulfobacillus harzensis TaxID=2729629 RepID=A0A7Y0L1G9_9FIRM|nr:AtpZ/AtpI family protein [Sulfobacillus harzensis]